jgi:hypothetical protein
MPGRAGYAIDCAVNLFMGDVLFSFMAYVM